MAPASPEEPLSTPRPRALLAVLLLLRAMHNATREPTETPWPKHHPSFWSKDLKAPGRIPSDTHGRSAVHS